jgi:chromate transport protein ChrA
MTDAKEIALVAAYSTLFVAASVLLFVGVDHATRYFGASEKVAEIVGVIAFYIAAIVATRLIFYRKKEGVAR